MYNKSILRKECDTMGLDTYVPFWGQLTPDQQALLLGAAMERTVPKGTLLHNGSADCVGLFFLRSGQLRAFILSEEGREVTLYRLFDGDTCLFSASCMMKNIQFDVTIEAEKDTTLWIIPPDIYQAMMDQSLAVSQYTNQLIASRFSEVMWLMEQIMWKSFDKRLAGFLLSESTLEDSDTLKITHEKLAAHLGTAREVVTRMLHYFQQEGLVSLSRGAVHLTDRRRLRALAE